MFRVNGHVINANYRYRGGHLINQHQ